MKPIEEQTYYVVRIDDQKLPRFLLDIRSRKPQIFPFKSEAREEMRSLKQEGYECEIIPMSLCWVGGK